LVIESAEPIETPSRYRNRFGQLLEHSPFCERDIQVPELQEPITNNNECLVKVKTLDGIQEYTYAHHPCDVVGWDGYYFPWSISIHDFEPIVGSIHQPPPVHQTFQGKGFAICSFVPRLFDFHPDSVPAPYPHSNVDSDEVIYYSRGDFMSRQGIQKESITLHPMGLPHGPQPGKYESSIGKKKTDELAVMIDTFKPLNVTKSALNIDDADYPLSWLD
jgi:homogentisate 1,2-dioxygenase